MTAIEKANSAFSFLGGGGHMGAMIRAKDWSETPLGSPGEWPQSLRTSVGLVLSSPFPILIAWGPETIQIYNDSYIPICGAKHPESLGQNFRICWETALPVVGDAFTRGEQGEGTYIKDQQMFLDRHGYLEEAFMTFSFTPISDELGKVGGIFHPITETTDKILSARRTQFLRDMAEKTSAAELNAEIYEVVDRALLHSNLDVPFVLFYELTAENELILKKSSGFAAGLPITPERISLDAVTGGWPFAEAIAENRSLLIENLPSKFGDYTCEPYAEVPHSAMLLPINIAGLERPFGFMIAGISSRRAIDNEYANFYALLGNTISTAFSRVYAYEQERKRAEFLAEVDRAKTTFFSNISHEFRTPLTLMLGPLEDALNSPQSITENETRLQMAYRNGLRLQKLVNTLLEFSRIEAGRVEGRFAQIDIGAFTRDLASTFRSAIEKAGMDLFVDYSVIEEDVFVDTDMWEKIVLNLISNAFKYTSEGSITVSLAQQGKNLRLSVTDTGTGIQEDQLHRIFERFHRIENFGGRSQEGTGIGLSMVKELVRLHGGAITVESEFGKGSTFIVEIPTGKDHLENSTIRDNKINATVSASSVAFVEEAMKWLPGESEKSSLKQEEYTHSKKHIRIVLADDNTDMRDYINRLLSPKYDIITATNGEEAFEKILQHKPDLILSDVMMPRTDGFGLLKIVREDDVLKHTPFIFLSARAGEESRVEGLQAGADDYLVKPFSAKELFAKVESTIKISSQRVEMEAQLKLMVAEKTKALIQSNEDLQQFAHVASHDLKEPVRKIRTFTDRLEKSIGSLADEKSRSYLQKINSASSRMVSMIEGVLAFSTVNAGDIVPERFSLKEVVKNIEEDLELSISKKEAVIETKDLPDVVGIRVQIYQLLYNLCSNSLKFSLPGKPVRISIGPSGAKVKQGYIELIVRDNGIGFDQQFASRIFETFTRLNSKDEYEGTGLGLALCKKIVERHGGEIRGESDEGKGTSIYFTLPVAKK